MALKTFNVDPSTYAQFRGFCKAHGLSMSAQVQSFMRSVMAEDLRVSQQYLDKLRRIRAEGSFIEIKDFGAYFDVPATRRTKREKDDTKARQARPGKVRHPQAQGR